MKAKWTIMLIIFVLTGCGATPKILDDIQLATVIGLDPEEDDKLSMTISFPVFKPDDSTTNETFTTTGYTFNGNLDKANARSSKSIETGKLDVIIINRKLAEKGMTEYLDFLKRGASTGARLFIVVADGSAKDVLEGKYEDTDLGVYLESMLQQNIQQRVIPETNFHLYNYAQFSEGTDPILPVMKKVKENIVTINGIAIMNKDQLIDILPLNKLFYFNAIYGDMAKGTKRTVDAKGNDAYIQRISSVRNLDYKPKEKKIVIHVDMKGEVLEYTGDRFDDGNRKEVEQNLTKQIKEESERLAKMFQEMEVDPLGLGDDIKHKIRGLSWDEWKKLYPELTIEVDVNVAIISKGIVQ
ncbi:Ger(x)C family spore germination protein [Aureibacillus halotolerans]|uniref:Spore germination protein n=1 Tax=Aureibacillus halotolerans TaxID=1508390 RepID=A0A4R6TSP7_9BACI|nr:Ger(x)C family spore germination protein [Aureibacillus halotolerans]TDQ36086.1 spore germination protein [Aureibacillus halotolerans]